MSLEDLLASSFIYPEGCVLYGALFWCGVAFLGYTISRGPRAWSDGEVFVGYRRVTFVQNLREHQIPVVLLLIDNMVDTNHFVTHKFVWQMWAILFLAIIIFSASLLYVGPSDDNSDEQWSAESLWREKRLWSASATRGAKSPRNIRAGGCDFWRSVLCAKYVWRSPRPTFTTRKRGGRTILKWIPGCQLAEGATIGSTGSQYGLERKDI